MPKNKRHVDRAVKQEQIEAAATELFIAQGYDATSMASIAHQAQVAPNTLYWYYENKDDLLVAVLNRLVSKGLAGYASVTDQPIPKQLLWMLKELEQSRALISLVHSRVEHSTQIQRWHTQFHQLLESVLVTQLVRGGMDKSEASTDATVVSYVVEGLLSHPHTQIQQQQIIERLVNSLLQKSTRVC